MGHSSPPNPNGPNGGSVSGLTVIVGLVLLVIAGTGFAVATYLAMGPVSLRRQAIAQGRRRGGADAERGQRRSCRPCDADAWRRHATRQPAVTRPRRRKLRSSTTSGDGPSADAMGDAGQRPSRESDPSDLSLTQLSPIEMVGTGANAGDWRGAVTSGGLAFGHAVSLRPAEDQGVAQIAFALKARFARFRGFAAIVGDETQRCNRREPKIQPQAVFRVYGDGNLLWESEPLIGVRQASSVRVRRQRRRRVDFGCRKPVARKHLEFRLGRSDPAGHRENRSGNSAPPPKTP